MAGRWSRSEERRAAQYEGRGPPVRYPAAPAARSPGITGGKEAGGTQAPPNSRWHELPGEDAARAGSSAAAAEELQHVEEARRLNLITADFERQIAAAAEVTARAVARTQLEQVGLAAAEARLGRAVEQLGVVEASSAAVQTETRERR